MSADVAKLSKSFTDNGKDLNEDEAISLLVEAEKNMRLIKEKRTADEKLTAAKNIAKDLGSGYSSAMAYEKAKVSFLLDRIQELQDGVNPTSGANK